MQLFATLRKIRELERGQLPFFKSLVDFDIVIEIGYAAEQNQPLTPKQLFLLELGSLTTVRRRLGRLVQQGIIRRRPHASDRRSAVLSLSAPSLKVLNKYGVALNAICIAG